MAAVVPAGISCSFLMIVATRRIAESVPSNAEAAAGINPIPGLSTVPIPIRRDPTNARDEKKSQKRLLVKSRVFIINHLQRLFVLQGASPSCRTF
jgi:hypothetical protein